MPLLKKLLGAAVALCSVPALAAEPAECPRQDGQAPHMPPPATMPSMKVDETMKSPMAPPGMTMMDVTREAAAKDNCMQPMLKHEEETMKPSKP